MAKDLDDIEAIAVQAHDNFEVLAEHLEHAHPREIVRRVERLADYFMHDPRFRETPGTFRSDLLRASWMIYSMELYGMDFESVCDVIDFTPATIVTGVSMDMRIPRDERYVRLRSQLAHNGHAVEILRLAEVWAVCDKFLHMRSSAQLRETLEHWLPAAEQWLAAMPLCRKGSYPGEVAKAAGAIRRKMEELNAVYLSERRKRVEKPKTASKKGKTPKAVPMPEKFPAYVTSLAG